MRLYWTTMFLVTGSLLNAPAHAHPGGFPYTLGSMVSVSVHVDGRPAPLYSAPDDSGRFYIEACKGSRYAVTLANRTAERLGIVLTVDGLNVISGERDERRGRMYVLDPWQSATVRGWRVSLGEVRQFTFVDEQISYAARSGKANEKMGWIEVAIFRERRRLVQPAPGVQVPPGPTPGEPSSEEAVPGDPGKGGMESQEGTRRAEASAPSAKRDCDESTTRSGRARSYPGTGWGQRRNDRAVLVHFDPEPHPSERATIRYEYLHALVALGVVPPPYRDRLWEREHAEIGFARPPRR